MVMLDWRINCSIVFCLCAESINREVWISEFVFLKLTRGRWDSTSITIQMSALTLNTKYSFYQRSAELFRQEDQRVTRQVSKELGAIHFSLFIILHLLNNTTHTTLRSMGAAYLRQQRRIQAGMVVKICE